MRRERIEATLGQLQRFERLVLLVWLFLFVAVCVRIVLPTQKNGVYPLFADAARHWWTSESLYLGDGDGYRYSPLVAALLTPFSIFPDRLGGIWWRGVNGAVLLAGLFRWWQVVLPSTLTRTQKAWFFLLIAPLVVGNINNGQSNPLVLGLLLLASASLVTRHWTWASGCLALATLFKLYPIAVGLLFVLIAPRRMGLRLGFAILVGLALPFLFQRSDYVAEQYSTWLKLLGQDDRSGLPRTDWYRDLRLLAANVGMPLSPFVYLLIQLTSAAGIAGFVLWCQRVGLPFARLLVVTLALACCWMTVVGPAAESATYVLLAPSLVWALLNTGSQFGSKGPTWVLTGTYLILLGSQMASWFPFGRQVHTMGLQPLAGLAFFGWLAFDTWKQARASGAEGNTYVELSPACAA